MRYSGAGPAPIERFLWATDTAPPATWQIARFLLDRGADEFSLTFIELDDGAAAHLADLAAGLQPFFKGTERREHLSAPNEDEYWRDTPVYTLSWDALPMLQEVFDDGLFGYPAYHAPAGWVEDPMIYRRGELVFGIVSHEAEGAVRLEPNELTELATSGILFRDHARRP